MAKTFVDEFGIEEEVDIKDVPDYETFTNKELLDDLRNKIIQNIIDNNTNNQLSMDNYISFQIEKTLEGYDIYKWLVFYQSKEKELVKLHDEVGKLLTKHMLDIPKEILDEFHEIGIDLR